MIGEMGRHSINRLVARLRRIRRIPRQPAAVATEPDLRLCLATRMRMGHSNCRRFWHTIAQWRHRSIPRVTLGGASIPCGAEIHLRPLNH